MCTGFTRPKIFVQCPQIRHAISVQIVLIPRGRIIIALYPTSDQWTCTRYGLNRAVPATKGSVANSHHELEIWEQNSRWLRTFTNVLNEQSDASSLSNTLSNLITKLPKFVMKY